MRTLRLTFRSTSCARSFGPNDRALRRLTASRAGRSVLITMRAGRSGRCDVHRSQQFLRLWGLLLAQKGSREVLRDTGKPPGAAADASAHIKTPIGIGHALARAGERWRSGVAQPGAFTLGGGCAEAKAG